MLFIVVYELFMGRSGVSEERPLAMFRNPEEANVFMDMLRQNGRRAFARAV